MWLGGIGIEGKGFGGDFLGENLLGVNRVRKWG